jgi:spore coat polysaccharide biosynthesis predicted glycosyltransferase SpsG
MTGRTLHIYTEAGAHVGHGHVRRTMTLAEALRRSGCTPTFLTADAQALGMIHAAGFAGDLLPGGLTQTLSRTVGVTHLIVDSYAVSTPWLEQCAAAGLRIAAFDDGCRLLSYPVDFVIDSAPMAEALPYHGRAGTRLLMGPDYFLLRGDLVRGTSSAQGENILVTMGGSDPDDATHRVLEALRAAGISAPVQVVLGGSYQGKVRVGRRSNVDVVANPASMASFFASAKVAITGAGQTALELASFAVPSILLQLSPDQQHIARGLASVGAAFDGGPHQQLSDSHMINVLRNLLADPARRETMGHAGRRLIDGRGAERIADALTTAWFGEAR